MISNKILMDSEVSDFSKNYSIETISQYPI